MIESVQSAFQSVLSQGLRSILTIIGVVIGIATIVALISLGNGLNQTITDQFEMMGMNTIMVEPGSAENMITTGFTRLQEGDTKIIESIPGVEKVIAFYEGSAIIKFKNQETSVMVLGIDPQKSDYMEEIGYINLEQGRNLRPGDKYSMIIYKSFAENEFEDEIYLRQGLEVHGKKFRVIGISKEMTLMMGFSSIIIVPEKTAKSFLEIEDPLEIAVLAKSKELIPKISEEIEDRLEKSHGEKNFYLITMEQSLEIAQVVLGIIQLFLIAIAAISLVVGGIGIMNTMLMSVIERTNEIGLMKATGATNNQVLTQFITEAGIIGLLGGTIGIIIGLGFAFLISIIAETSGFSMPISISIELVLGAMIFALVVGIISGIIPAQRAAKLDPVDALRYE
ncbi:MAG: ABC transporter permease [Candidatus Diapherotrites archaeon]